LNKNSPPSPSGKILGGGKSEVKRKRGGKPQLGDHAKPRRKKKKTKKKPTTNTPGKPSKKRRPRREENRSPNSQAMTKLDSHRGR